MTRTIAILALCIGCLFSSVHAQTPQSAIERIQNAEKGRYIWGEGRADTEEQAKEIAFGDLISKLAVNVEFGQKIGESQNNDRYDINQENVTKKSWAGTIENCESITFRDKDGWFAFRYVAAEELRKAQERRRERIAGLVALGIEQEQNLNIAGALKYYMWALKMLSYYKDHVKTSVKGREHDTAHWLQEKIPSVLNSLTITLDDNRIDYDEQEYDHYTVNIAVAYDGKPVSALDLGYFNGERQISPFHVKNGEGALRFPDLSGFSAIDLKVIYDYREEASRYDPELAVAYREGPQLSFYERSHTSLPVKIKKDKITVAKGSVCAPPVTADAATAPLIGDMRPTITRSYLDEPTRYVDAMRSIEEAIRTKSYESVKQLFTPEGYEIFDLMMHSGNVRISKRQEEYSVETSPLFIVGKSLPVTIKYGRHTTNEKIVFRFDAGSGLIKSVAYALTKRAEDDIFRKAQWNMDSRYSLLTFMEDYQTAFALKRLNYIQKIFSDNAIIITGKVQSREGRKFYDGAITNLGDKVIYKRQTKDEYMRNLEADFKKKDYIQLVFEDAEISKAATDGFLDNEVLWIEIKQQYDSPSYSDKGFLALQINMKPSGSQINVRTWTPGFVELDELKKRFPIGF